MVSMAVSTKVLDQVNTFESWFIHLGLFSKIHQVQHNITFVLLSSKKTLAMKTIGVSGSCLSLLINTTQHRISRKWSFIQQTVHDVIFVIKKKCCFWEKTTSVIGQESPAPFAETFEGFSSEWNVIFNTCQRISTLRPPHLVFDARPKLTV